VANWLIILSWLSLCIAFVSAGIIGLHLVAGHRQHMSIMNLVWPLTALYAGPIALWGYFRYGTASGHHAMMAAKERGEPKPAEQRPYPVTVALATTHCGSGCTLGDIVAEWGIVLFPGIVTWLGYQTLWHEKIFSGWALDFLIAFLLGIAFQYLTIVPMKKLPPGKGIIAALKADTLSLTAWQVGMYGWMAIATFAIIGHEIPKRSPVFWFMMQIAMLAGFATSYPVNWWLVATGIKEKM